MRSTILLVVGTRPEAIKMAPVVEALRESDSDIHLHTVSTGQHKTLLTDGLAGFTFPLTKNLGISNEENDLRTYFSKLINALSIEIDQVSPDLVLVHGDTLSASAAAIAAHFSRVPVGHVEAGLRSHRLDSPWPEEANRRIIDSVSTLFFCPTDFAQQNILPDSNSKVFVTGNTVIDALKKTLERVTTDKDKMKEFREKYSYLGEDFIIVTLHRRESFGDKHREILLALNEFATAQNPIIFPVHPNPLIHEAAIEVLTNKNIHVVAPLPYPEFVYLMSKARIGISDSGGIQEEAPALGLPLLITRNITERPEALEEKTNEIIGHDGGKIVTRLREILQTPRAQDQGKFRKGVFGDGNSGGRIAQLCLEFLKS
jgi:UDP-N-acetylglucosamine 2-epimerase (non-hydrolysing)